METDQELQIFKHIGNVLDFKLQCDTDLLKEVIDSVFSPSGTGLKEAMHVPWIKPSQNNQHGNVSFRRTF